MLTSWHVPLWAEPFCRPLRHFQYHPLEAFSHQRELQSISEVNKSGITVTEPGFEARPAVLPLSHCPPLGVLQLPHGNLHSPGLNTPLGKAAVFCVTASAGLLGPSWIWNFCHSYHCGSNQQLSERAGCGSGEASEQGERANTCTHSRLGKAASVI